MATFGYELLAALKALLAEFDDGEGGGTNQHMATITPQYRAELEALIARARDQDATNNLNDGDAYHGQR